MRKWQIFDLKLVLIPATLQCGQYAGRFDEYSCMVISNRSVRLLFGWCVGGLCALHVCIITCVFSRPAGTVYCSMLCNVHYDVHCKSVIDILIY